MRKILISLLLASAAASPALADRPDDRSPTATASPRRAASRPSEERAADRARRVQRPQLNGRQPARRSEPQRSQPRAKLASSAAGDQRRRAAIARAFAATSRNRGREQRAARWRSRRQQVVERQPRAGRAARATIAAAPVRPGRCPTSCATRDSAGRQQRAAPGTQPPLRDATSPRQIAVEHNWRNDNRYDWRN